MVDVDMALTFLSFVEERHRIWQKRQQGLPQPWTRDPVLATRKFTNVFRVLDPGSQFVLTELADPSLSNRDQLLRLFLYRHTGRVEAWQYAEITVGDYPTLENLGEIHEAWRDYRQGRPFFTGAYLVFPQSATPGTDKLDSIIDLTRRLFTPGSPQDVLPDWNRARTQEESFNVLRRNKGVADFMSMQILTDWGYLENSGQDLENDFVVAGPGATRGAKYLAPDWTPLQTILWGRKAISSSPQVPLLNGRKPSLMDVQNCLCEFSKYVRFQGKAGTPYKPAHPGEQPDPVLPAHWTEKGTP